jgi:hypothetical protein
VRTAFSSYFEPANREVFAGASFSGRKVRRTEGYLGSDTTGWSQAPAPSAQVDPITAAIFEDHALESIEDFGVDPIQLRPSRASPFGPQL